MKEDDAKSDHRMTRKKIITACNVPRARCLRRFRTSQSSEIATFKVLLSVYFSLKVPGGYLCCEVCIQKIFLLQKNPKVLNKKERYK